VVDQVPSNQLRSAANYPEADFSGIGLNAPAPRQAYVVKGRDKCRYELVWKDRSPKRAIVHSKRLHNVDKASDLAVSELLTIRND